MITAAEAAAVGIAEPQVLAGLEFARAEHALASGRFHDAYDAAHRAIEHWKSFHIVLQSLALRAALWAGDAEMAQPVLDQLAAEPNSGKLALATRAWAAAVSSALEEAGPETIRRFAAAIEAARSLSVHWDEARMILDAVKLFPEVPEVRAWAPAARETFERLRVKPYLEMLDAALDSAPGVASSSATETASVKAASAV